MTEQQYIQTTVLVIDVVAENISLLTEDLEADGYRVLSSTKGLTGIVIALEQQPDVVLLDLMTSDIDGFKVCRLLKDDQRTCKIPIILISSREDLDEIMHGSDLGATDYISKPFHYPIAAAMIQSAISAKRSLE